MGLSLGRGDAEFVAGIVVLPAAEVNTSFIFPPAREGSVGVSPTLPSTDVQDHLHLVPLGLLGQHVAFLGRGKAALRREAELVERDELRRLLDALLDVVLLLQRSGFRGHEAEHDLLVALRHEAQRLEAAGPLGVVFEEIAVVVHLPNSTSATGS